MGHKATKSAPTHGFHFGTSWPTEPKKSPLCAAEVGSNDRFLIHKRTFGEAAANDRFWPKAAVALKPSRMSELGQQRTSSAIAIYVRFWG